MTFFKELRRRKVFRAGMAYVVVVWIILQVSDVILGNIQAPPWIFHVILLLIAIGFPLALLFAWLFELTPEGFKRELEIDEENALTETRFSGRQIDYMIICLLVLALGYFIYDKMVLSKNLDGVTAGAVYQAGIAVLPFENLTSDKEQDYFSDGLSEELLNLLAKIPELRVIARTSSFSFKGKDVTIEDIARELNVAHVLEGSVRKDGGTMRITAQLIRASDSTHLWSDAYDRTQTNIFAIQDDIAQRVVRQLKIRLLGEAPTSQETDPAAYALYLQARELTRQSTAEGHKKAIELYEQALKIAPEYTAALAGLAENYIFLAGRVLVPIDEGYQKAREAAKKALGIDPDVSTAHASLGRIAMVHDKDLAAAANHLQHALELEPNNSQIIRSAAILSLNLARLDEAITLLETAVSLDPVSSAVHANLALVYFSAGQLDKTIASYETTLALSPNSIGVHSWLGEAYLAKNDTAAALAEMQKEQSRPWQLIGLAMAHHASGQADESAAIQAELIEEYGADWPYNIAYVLAYRNEIDRAFEWLEKAQQNNDPGLSEVAIAPEFANLRSDPRWLPFLQSIGKAPEQLAEVRFEVTRSIRN